MNILKSFIKKYGLIFIYYFFEYFLSFLIFWLILAMWKPVKYENLLSNIYLFIVYLIIPVMLLFWVATWYKKYSLKGLVDISLASFLIAIPPLHIRFLAFGIIDWTSTLLNQYFIEYFGMAAAYSLLVGLIGISLNSVYILILRFIKRV